MPRVHGGDGSSDRGDADGDDDAKPNHRDDGRGCATPSQTQFGWRAPITSNDTPTKNSDHADMLSAWIKSLKKIAITPSKTTPREWPPPQAIPDFMACNGRLSEKGAIATR